MPRVNRGTSKGFTHFLQQAELVLTAIMDSTERIAVRVFLLAYFLYHLFQTVMLK